MKIHKKYNTSAQRFVLFLTMGTFFACGSNNFGVTTIEGKKVNISSEYTPTQSIEDFVKPYRDHIDKDLDSVLAYSPETLDKSKSISKWQTTIGNLMADVTFDKSDKVLMARQQRHVDVCLLNNGGIRAIIPKGNVTARTAFEIMPFENSVWVVALKGEQLVEIGNYIIREKKPHPLSGMEIVIGKDGLLKSITVQGKPVEAGKIYNVATSDYLANGGDSMDFFKKGVTTYDIDYKLRNIFIDYFKEVDTLPVIKTERIIMEK